MKLGSGLTVFPVGGIESAQVKPEKQECAVPAEIEGG